MNPGASVRDILRWLLMFVLTFGTGAIQAMVDGHSAPVDMLRHGFIGLLPTIAALKMTLEGKGGAQ